MDCPAASSSNENKPECNESLIDNQGKRTCQTKKRVLHPVATDSIENILKCKELLIDIPLVLERARWPECCIYKVPKKLRDVNKKSYNPKLISIGPLHHGEPELKDMQLQKLRFLKEFCYRKRTREITQKELAGIIEENEVKIRRCYASAANTSKLSRSEFINMILLDAIFIIELFLRNATFIIELFLRNATWSKHALHDLVASAVPNLLPSIDDKPEDADDYMFSDKWLSYHLRQDLLLLENQLPFFILKELWDKSNYYSSSDHHREEQQQAKEDTSFLRLAFAYFYELHPEHEQKPSWKEVKQVTDIQSCTNFREKVKGEEVKHFEEHLKDMLSYTEDGKKVKHFTDMLRYFFYSKDMGKVRYTKFGEKIKPFIDILRRPSKGLSSNGDGGVDSKKDGGSIKHLYSATQLDEAGVKFKGVENRPLLDINFEKNACLEHCPCLNCSWLFNCLPCLTCLKNMQHFLEVPTFEVNDETECVFRNLMAFEQCHSPSIPFICNYVLLLDRLINSSNDVDLLVDEKAIVNFLGSNERVANLVNKLCLEIVEPEKSPYNDLSERLNKHYRSSWNKHMASLSKVYFKDFWRGTATVVGLFVVVLTLWNLHRRLFL